MIRRVTAGLAAAAAVSVAFLLRRRVLRGRAVEQATTNRVAAADARSLVESALGRRPERRRLTINFAPATATSWELLIDGPSFFPRLMADIEAATSDVHIIIFGFKDGDIGQRFRDLLLRKVSEGVPVRLIVDASYSQPGLGSRDFYAPMIEGGVQVVVNMGAFIDLDGPIGQRRPDWRFDDLGHFDHRKIVVVDGRVAFVGGPGIEDHYADDQFHDMMLRLEGPVVAQVQAAFLLSWHFQGGPLPDMPQGLDRFFPTPPTGDGIDVEILMNNPGEGWLPIRPALREAVNTAERRLYVINPYLADHPILRGIVDAGQRGVDTRVFVPQDPRSPVASGAVRHWFGPMLEAGVNVREHLQMAHAKVVLADDTVLLGTANLDALSLRQNFEMQLRVHDTAFADHVARELFDKDIEKSVPGEAPTSWADRVRNEVFSAMSPFL
jgi:cardiolipin synthase A/B